MGIDNRQRRASKRKRRRDGAAGARRREAAHQPRSGTEPPHPGPSPGAEDLLLAAVHEWGADPNRYDAVLAALAAVADAALPLLDDLLTRALDGVWRCGWTPADLVRVVTRELGAAHGDVAAALVVADGRTRSRRGQQLDPRWQTQLELLADAGAADRSAGPEAALRIGVDLLCLLTRLEALQPTLPPPGAAAPSPTGGLDERVIARHAIDEALLHAADDVGAPSARRIHLDAPYADSKATLLSEVADANRCRVVYSAAWGWVTAFGYDRDLDAVELLATSLLAQATGAMARHGSRRDATGRSRTRSFRRSFLLGFAQRIGQRLREATDEQVAAASPADRGRLLPVLAARDERIDAAVADAFPELEQKAGTVSYRAGFAAGQAAADLADLDVSAGALRDARAS